MTTYTERKKTYYHENKDRLRAANKEYRRKNADKIRSQQIQRLYGIDLIEYEKIFNIQGGKCAICKTPQSDLHYRLVIDHCHTTGIVRGLLCYCCNSMIGQAKDNTDILMAGCEYLKQSFDVTRN